MPSRHDILEAAVRLGEARGWDAVHLHDVARELNVPLATIAAEFASKDAIAEAWFDRADAALLRAAEMPGWRELPVPDRLERAILAWLNALAPHRALARAMLGYKLQPEHLHLQALGALRVSGTVQWIREVALIDAVGWRRELVEAGLTGIYLASVASWLTDESPDARRTRALLRRLLGGADALVRLDPAWSRA